MWFVVFPTEKTIEIGIITEGGSFTSQSVNKYYIGFSQTAQIYHHVLLNIFSVIYCKFEKWKWSLVC